MSIQVHHTPVARKTFFFERRDGSIFATEELEASTLVKNDKFKLIGVSDGRAFAQKIITLQNDFILGNLTEEDRRTRILAAEREEIELARGHIEMPRDFSRTDIAGNPIQIKI